MLLSCQQQELKSALSAVSHAVANKSALPILLNVLLETEHGCLKLAGTDLEIGITSRIPAMIEEEGSVTLPARLLSDVVSSLPNDRISLALDARTQTITLECGRYVTNIKGIEPDDFPPIPTIEDGELTFSVPAQELRSSIDQVSFAAATDESRPVLTGVLVRIVNNTLMLVAADGFRLAMSTIPLADTSIHRSDISECIIPARALNELSRLPSEGDDISITVTGSGKGQILFHAEPFHLVSRLIDGKFPDFERVIPTEWKTRTVVNTQEFLKAVKLASYFATASQNIVKLTMEVGRDREPNKLTITANATEVGDNRGVLEGVMQGENGQIALNVRFLSDTLSAIKTYQVEMHTQTPDSPGVFRPLGDDSYLQIIMPMTLR